MTPRDLFHRIMRFECPGQTLLTLGGIWPSTLDRWHAEGMPEELRTIPDLIAHFGLERHVWTSPKAELFVYPAFEHRIVGETAETVTYVNNMGITCTDLKKNAYQSMPHFEAFPVKGRDDWRAFRRRLEWSHDRVGEAWEAQKCELRTEHAPVIMALNRGGSLYGVLRDMVGMAGLSLLFYDDPALVAEMMDTMLELSCRCIDALFTDYVPDAVCLWEDMAYTHGSLLGIDHVREFMLPRYRVMVAKLREKGVPFIVLDSDGNIEQLIPIVLDSGIDGVVPMEAQSGMDVAVYREKYPQLLMMGGVDKKALAAGPDAIDHEIDKIRRTIASGGFIPWFDHGLPHDASYPNFRYFIDQLHTLNP